MKFKHDFSGESFSQAQLQIYGVFCKEEKLQVSWQDKDLQKYFLNLKAATNFTGATGTSFNFTSPEGTSILVIGLGEKTKCKNEQLRKAIAKTYKQIKELKFTSVAIDLHSFNSINNLEKALMITQEAITLANYSYDQFKSKKIKLSFSEVIIHITDAKLKRKVDALTTEMQAITESVNFARDLVNQPPNILNSEEYAKQIEKDVKANLKTVKIKIMGKAELKKEKMDMFLSVNNGSAYDPKLVHLTYTPKKVTKNTKHICLVGKGLTFDTGGYSLKPGESMMGMKFDMGGSSTVYGAFRAAVLSNSPVKITCILGMTDNMINSYATTPDSIVKARNGKTVEILNTDAEGRLVLGDCLDYACDLNPNVIIDAATLTGACLVALGSEVCAILGNNDKVISDIKKSAKETDEYIWQLPIIDEWREEMKSHVADLKNIGKGRFAGTATASAFLENFIKNDIAWAHLDIAGVCDSQAHLPYCPAKGGSGLMVRTLHNYLMNAK